jgi:hypothetical protein
MKNIDLIEEQVLKELAPLLLDDAMIQERFPELAELLSPPDLSEPERAKARNARSRV